MTHRLGAVAAAAFVLALGGCSASGDGEAGEGPATIYVSLPLRGSAGEDGRDAADGARLALADAQGRAGEREIRGVFLDDSERRAGGVRWTPARVGANARRATRDSTALAYIGDFESGATRTSLPITNDARMLQVSPASAAMDLVVEPGSFDDVPDLQPSGERSFGRVIPGDDAQAEAAAIWARRLGATAVAARPGASEFGRSMVAEFTQEARERGLTVRRADATRGDLLYAPAPPDSRRDGWPPRQRLGLMTTDAALALDAPPAPAGAYVTSAALDTSQLSSAGDRFVARFRERYGRAPGRYAAYGYEAMAVVLEAIDRAGEDADRAAVIDAFFELGERDSILGEHAITELGETTLDRLTGYRVTDGGTRPVALLSTD